MKKILALIAIITTFGGLYAMPSVFAEEPSVDALLDLILNDSGSVSTTTGETTVDNKVVNTSTTTPAGDTEFVSAVGWMYDQGLTKYNTTTEYQPERLLTREQAAKFFVQMQEKMIGIPVANNANCTFSDKGFDDTLLPFVKKACAYGIMQGSKGVFRPTDVISKPEFVAAVIRMIEGAKRDETMEPWWLSYYQQARDRALTKEQNANAFGGNISRYEAALFLYRAKAIIITKYPTPVNNNDTTNNTTNNTGNTTGNSTGDTKDTDGQQGSSTDGTGINNTTSDNSSNNNSNANMANTAVSDPALQEAIYWMYDKGLTRYSTIEDFRPFDPVTRQEAAKIFTLFRHAIMQGIPDSAGSSCNFTDLNTADPTLVSYITESCTLQILKGSNGLFQPLETLKKPQAVAILIRMLEGYKDETKEPRWQEYYDRAVALGLIQKSTPTNFDKNITRYEVAMLLYNTKVKQELLKNLNNNYEINKLVYTLADSVTTGSNSGEKVGLISINTPVLERNDLLDYIVDLFGSQYVIQKVATQKYLNNDYVLYAKMLSLDKTENIGTAAFTLSNGVVISGVFRPYNIEGYTYSITPSSKQPYYNMTMSKR